MVDDCLDLVVDVDKGRRNRGQELLLHVLDGTRVLSACLEILAHEVAVLFRVNGVNLVHLNHELLRRNVGILLSHR